MRALLLAIAALAPAAALAQDCGDRDATVAYLAEEWRETIQSAGISSNGFLTETFASLETGTWTVLVTSPEGVTCIASSGEYYEELDVPLPPQGTPG